MMLKSSFDTGGIFMKYVLERDNNRIIGVLYRPYSETEYSEFILVLLKVSAEAFGGSTKIDNTTYEKDDTTVCEITVSKSQLPDIFDLLEWGLVSRSYAADYIEK